MRTEDWFALALRVVRVVILLYGTGYLLDSLLFRLGYFNYPDSSPRYYVVAGLSYVFAGLYLLRGAPHLVKFAYPEEEEDESLEEDDNGGQEDA